MKRRTSSAKSKTRGHGLPSPLVCKSPKSVWASCQQGHAVEKQQGRVAAAGCCGTHAGHMQDREEGLWGAEAKRAGDKENKMMCSLEFQWVKSLSSKKMSASAVMLIRIQHLHDLFPVSTWYHPACARGTRRAERRDWEEAKRAGY